jgi:hypothetical protein
VKKKKVAPLPTPAEIARYRYLRATVLRCSLRYYYPGVDPGEPPEDWQFDSLEHELEVMCTDFRHFDHPKLTDRGASGFRDWLLSNPDKKLGPLVIDVDPKFSNGWCG